MHALKDQDRQSSKQPTLRVLAVGDCNTYGLHEPPIGNTILDKFCECLEEHGYGTARQNLGCGMATTREGVQRMRLDAQPADVVLINFGLVDAWITSIPRLYVPCYPENWRRRRLRKILKFVKRRLRWPILRRIVPTGAVVSLDEFAQNVRDMIAAARAKNPKVAILLWGSPPVQHDPARNTNLSRYNRRLESLAIETATSFVSTDPIVNRLSAQQAYVDAVHLSEAATEAIAAQLAAVYRSRQLAAAS